MVCVCHECGRCLDVLIIKGYLNGHVNWIDCIRTGEEIYEDWFEMWFWRNEEIGAHCPHCFSEICHGTPKEVMKFIKECF